MVSSGVLIAAACFYAGGGVGTAFTAYPDVRDDPFESDDRTEAVTTFIVCLGIGLMWPRVVYWSVSGWFDGE